MAKTPKGRITPHPHDAKKADGTIDLMAAGQGMVKAGYAYLSGEYTLKDMNEVAVTSANAAQIASLCGLPDAADGDEIFVALRHKN